MCRENNIPQQTVIYNLVRAEGGGGVMSFIKYDALGISNKSSYTARNAFRRCLFCIRSERSKSEIQITP